MNNNKKHTLKEVLEGSAFTKVCAILRENDYTYTHDGGYDSFSPDESEVIKNALMQEPEKENMVGQAEAMPVQGQTPLLATRSMIPSPAPKASLSCTSLQPPPPPDQTPRRQASASKPFSQKRRVNPSKRKVDSLHELLPINNGRNR